MIRINLHPVRAQKKVQAGKRQLMIFALIVVAELGLMGFLLSWQSAAIDKRRRESGRLKAQIEQLKKEVGDFDQLKAQREQLTAYEMLLRRDPNAGFNPRWNPNRLWIDTFTEQAGNVHIVGKAKDYGDVAEFNKRIHLSKYFTNDFLERNDQIFDSTAGLKVVRFSMRCRVTY
jgi:Tfp pilus assembly protein PilN